MTDFHIDSNTGRIGQFWWINSNQQPIADFIPVVVGNLDLGMVVKAKLIRWGTCGYGRKIRVSMQPIDD